MLLNVTAAAKELGLGDARDLESGPMSRSSAYRQAGAETLAKVEAQFGAFPGAPEVLTGGREPVEERRG